MKVLLVDDHPMVRKGLLSVLSLEENIEQIKEASDEAEAIKLLPSFAPDIMMVDLRLGQDDGLQVVLKAKKISPATKTIILTSSSRRDDFQRAQEIGVDGYILKDAYAEDILYAFHAVERGRKFFDPNMLEHKQTQSSELNELTNREKEVLLEMGKGFSNMQIAKRLFISENTVKKHISSIFGKLGLNHRVEAVVYVNNTFKFE